MKNFQIWTEGYSVNNQTKKATFWGNYLGRDFKEAVTKAVEKTGNECELNHFDYNKLTFWGCRFFSNEKAARKSFG